MAGRPLDVIRDAVDGLSTRPGRTFLTAAGVAFATATTVLVVGLAGLSRSEVAEVFESRARPFISIEPSSSDQLISTTSFDRAFPAPGVASAVGARRFGSAIATAHPSMAGQETEVDIVGIHGEVIDAVGITLKAGRGFDQAHIERADRVALVSTGAAAQLDLPPTDGRSRILISNEPYLVIGTFDSDAAGAGLGGSILIPYGARSPDLSIANGFDVVFARSTDQGDVLKLAEQLSVRIRPDQPESLIVASDPGDPIVTASVLAELERLTFVTLLAGGTVGALIVAAMMSATVIERRPEIGLRRALGARRRDIVSQFLIEGFLLGAFGAGIGVIASVVALRVMASARGVTLQVPDFLVGFAVAQGPLVGLIASLVPAVKAANQDPVEVLSG